MEGFKSCQGNVGTFRQGIDDCGSVRTKQTLSLEVWQQNILDVPFSKINEVCHWRSKANV